MSRLSRYANHQPPVTPEVTEAPVEPVEAPAAPEPVTVSVKVLEGDVLPPLSEQTRLEMEAGRKSIAGK